MKLFSSYLFIHNLHWMNYSKILYGFLLTVLFYSCQKHIDAPAASSLPAQTILNVSYGSSTSQNMDVYLPAARTTAATKVLILVHGGSWNGGDKNDLTEYVDSFRKRMPDYAFFNINYRLATTPTTLFPTQETDVKAALQFIYDKAQEYVISQKFVLTGVSAGGHLALLQAYKYSSPVKVKAVISFFGPTDLIDMYNNPTNIFVKSALVAVVGKTPAQDSLLYANSSPINFINNASPPTLLLHGGLDPLVRPTQSAAVKTKLLAAGVINDYIFYPNEGHGWFGANLIDSFNKLQAFLQTHVN